MQETTLCYIEKEGQYLMLFRNKKKEDENAGKWIGVGGKLEKGESAEECLLREVLEETGLKLLDYSYRGIITFVSKKSGDDTDIYTEIMHLYTADKYSGTLKECNEGELKWIAKDELFSLPMWEGDREFLKLLAEDAPFFKMTLEYTDGKLMSAEKE